MLYVTDSERWDSGSSQASFIPSAWQRQLHLLRSKILPIAIIREVRYKGMLVCHSARPSVKQRH